MASYISVRQPCAASVLPPKCVQSADLLGKGNLEKGEDEEKHFRRRISGMFLTYVIPGSQGV